jgi:hypothetical protein
LIAESRLVSDQSPVQRADDDEHGRNDIDELHHYLLI